MSRTIRLVGAAGKKGDPKKIILGHFANNGNTTIPELSKDLDVSVPKVTSLVNELIQEGLIKDYGKIESSGGRKPNLYGIVPDSAFFIGVDVKQSHINIGLSDLQKNLVKISEKLDYRLDNTAHSLESLCSYIENFIAEIDVPSGRVLGIGINLSGRINYTTGHSYSFFHFDENPLAEIIHSRVGIPVFLENDSRAMAYGEFCAGAVQDEKDVLFLNLDYGIGVGILFDGQLYYGKSGYAGEVGHMPFFDNERICHCGKKGCLETEASGWALTRMFREKLAEGSSSVLTSKRKMKPEDITMDHIIDAALGDDVLAIELIARVGENLGRGIAALINVLNPELVVLGGSLISTGDYLYLPIKTALNKYSLSLVNNDSQLKMSTLGEQAGILGACLLVRNRVLAI
ncbi:Sugar kinase of the NBD/HSP70 family, may contain an N-terminal HTH domain [Dyadobacter koreensis]|uniref:Sugar kinase of the NBD/HSP70 family, may contain an N-terminal HTH domain n=1 Tax=Dyadobacter koreensis TaxID=408657 RepID=A0A1H6QI96_9BACT|nr:ROK family transcriptional regulator [Dyadobacter koreensis]SEI40684.1 Sugar kinase of the NBD/HSP70 family, may contain an N-terminal HTH domain [Dyadobacter koreensis]